MCSLGVVFSSLTAIIRRRKEEKQKTHCVASVCMLALVIVSIPTTTSDLPTSSADLINHMAIASFLLVERTVGVV